MMRSWSLAALLVVGILALSACVPALVAGGLGAAYVVQDRRTADTMVADERIEKTASSRIKSEVGEELRFDINSFNRSVVLTGEAKTEEARRRAERLAAEIPGVRNVYNEIHLVEARGFREQVGDASLSTQVKARMVGNGVFNPLHVHITTDGGVVYLQGLVTRAEGQEAARIASTTSGVRKVVPLFEYLPDNNPPR